jgi:peptidyl-prolyl cis-trans isomerase B (cyclophilin B)
MSTKKQSQASKKRRQEQLQRKHAERAVKQRRQRIIAGVVAAVLVGGSGLWLILAFALSNDSDADPQAAPRVTQQPTPGWAASPAPPDAALAEGRIWTVSLDTNQGPITVELDGVNAPLATASFLALAGDDYFANTECHRLVTEGIFVLQCGDPTATGSGGPNYSFGPVENAPQDDLYVAGTLAMARQSALGVGAEAAAQSMGSQFFIVYEDSTIPSDEAGGYTVFGRVTQGLAIVEDVARAGTVTGDADGRPAQSVIINEVEIS